MADFAAVLRKTIDGLKENTPEMRQRVYDKARATIDAKLAAVTPPPSPAVVERQKKLLEDAIVTVEADYAPPPPAPDEENDFDKIFAEFESNDHPLKREAAAAPSPVFEEPEGDVSEDRAEEVHPISGVDAEEDRDVGSYEPFDVEERREEPERRPVLPARPRRSKGIGRLVAALVVLAVLGGAAYGVWLNRSEFITLLGLDEPPPADVVIDGAPADPRNALSEEQDQAAAPEGEEETTPEETKPSKFTQRLTADGQEIDEGPAGGTSGLGEGRSVASATSPATADEPAPGAEEQAPETVAAGETGEEGVAVGQRAIFYEERTSTSQGSAETGSIVWSLVQESPGGDLPPEPAIRGEATIPGKDVQLRLTIRRNGDESLPASHIIEMIFLTPDDFEGGGIDNVLRIAMKRSEQDTGNPLLGIPAKIADGFFLVALSDTRAEVETNTLLLRRQDWIDIPIVYKSGRRALITMEKGIPGERVFNEALDAWQNASSG
ncbi:MAG TPA: hypothetical protein VFT89_02515 [Rhizobiaceae bacterium]|nr:hypothetical protein [Rhizobiaceae bacterium]